jgi:hypothetical protein
MSSRSRRPICLRSVVVGAVVALAANTSAASAETANMAPSRAKPPATESALLFFNGGFKTCNLSKWRDFHDAWLTATPPGFAVGASPSFNGCTAKVNVTNQASTSVSGDASMLWEGNGSNSYQLPWLQDGSDTWFRMQVLFPDSTNPAYPGRFTVAPIGGGWDTIEAWHAAPGAGYSTYVGIDPGRPPCLTFRLVGGPAANQTFTHVYQTNRASHHRVPLRYNHWYDIVVHLVFGTTSETGFAQWWVDGILQYSEHVPTMSYLPDGSVPGVGHEVGLYRGPSRTDTDNIYIAGVSVGPTPPARSLPLSRTRR